MPFKYSLSEELKKILKKFFQKDKKRYEAILKKIEEIVTRDTETIDFYKNLRHDMKDFKRVHIDKSFVLLFRVYRKEKFILFQRFKHHDQIY
ncbi:MAG: addiction module toxin RelE [Candidatus Diapherotrites archaeon CG11_big_fil_rev_8_21_14_0_20_37_9]|nr:MAG: addiction module toxin RelE [Candidatus Diapherotrites archaeon CG11_big_fil_rev_8_21_14_0_20_37_9]